MGIDYVVEKLYQDARRTFNNIAWYITNCPNPNYELCAYHMKNHNKMIDEYYQRVKNYE